MPDDIGSLRHQLAEIQDASLKFFADVEELVATKNGPEYGDYLWEVLQPEQQTWVEQMQARVGQTIGRIGTALKGWPIIGESQLTGEFPASVRDCGSR